MDVTITIGELAQALLFVLVAAVGVYAVFILKRIHAVTSQLSVLISENEARLKDTALHLARLMENSAEISTQVRNGIGQAGQTLKAIGRETAETVLTINKTADYVSTYAVVIHEVLKSVINVFSGRK